MKKSGWIILTLFIMFFINALIKEKEFLAPDEVEVSSAMHEQEISNTKIISTISFSGYKRIVLSNNTRVISDKSSF